MYIGQSWAIIDRMSKYRTCKCDNQPKICNSIKKYGFNNHKFEIIFTLPENSNQQEADKYEQFYIDYYRNSGAELMNLREAGSRGRHSEETKAKFRGKKVSEETKEKLRKAATGKKLRPMTDEEKRLKSEVAKGKTKSESHIQSMKKSLVEDYASGKRRKYFGEEHWNRKLDTKQVGEIKEKYKTGEYRHKDLAIEYSISATTVCNIVNNKIRKNG